VKSRPRVRKAKATVAGWSRPVAVFAVTAVATTGGALAAWSHLVPYITGNDYFRLRSIRISSDETRVTPQTLAEVAGLYDDESLWDIDPKAIRDTLREASWVHEANVARHFPWQVSLSVSKRHAVAAAIASGKSYLVDEDAVLFREVDQTSVPDLPYLTGWDSAPSHAEAAGRLRSLLGLLPEAARRKIEVSELHMDEDGSVWLYAVGVRASVRLGSVEKAPIGMDRLSIALKELGNLSERARLIDTDYRDRIVIRGADDKLPAMLAAETETGGTAAAFPLHSSHPASPVAKATDEKAARHG
jgi:cell division septal protein FtsQ